MSFCMMYHISNEIMLWIQLAKYFGRAVIILALVSVCVLQE
jgi:hypothetical protein